MDEDIISRPGHYQNRWLGRDRDNVDALDVSETFFMDQPHLFIAFKHMARAGRKEGVPFETDIRKAIEYLSRALDFHLRNAAGDDAPVLEDAVPGPENAEGQAPPTGDAGSGNPQKRGFFDRRE